MDDQIKNNNAENNEINADTSSKKDTVTTEQPVNNEPEIQNLPVEDGAEKVTDDNTSNTEIEVSDAEDEEMPPPYQSKLTPAQSTAVQWILGIGAGFLIWLFLYLGSDPEFQGGLVSWMWVIIFAAVMFGKNAFEKRTGTILRTFMKAFLIGMIVFLGVFILTGVATGKFQQ